MAKVENKLTTRPATIADQEDVMGLSGDLFGGLDYLPGVYHLWEHDPRVHTYTFMFKGKVVGYFAFIALSKDHILGKAGRIHTGYQSLGFSETAFSIGVEHMSEKHGLSQFNLISTFHQNDKTRRFLGRFPNWKSSHEWHILAFTSQTSAIITDGMFEEIPGVLSASKRCHHASLSQLMQPQVLTEIEDILKTYGFLFCYGSSLAVPITSNSIKEAAQKSNVVLSTKNATPETKRHPEICAISFSSSLRVRRGIRVDIWLYSRDSSIATILSHIKLHMEKTTSVCKDHQLGILVYLPLQFKPDDVLPHLQKWLGKRFTVPPYDPSGSTLLAGVFHMSQKSKL